MIASVVATLDCDPAGLPHLITDLAKLPNVEVGEIATGSRRIPMVMDAPDPTALEALTRRLQDVQGVAFVDVVWVHFEGENQGAPTPSIIGIDQP